MATPCSPSASHESWLCNPSHGCDSVERNMWQLCWSHSWWLKKHTRHKTCTFIYEDDSWEDSYLNIIFLYCFIEHVSFFLNWNHAVLDSLLPPAVKMWLQQDTTVSHDPTLNAKMSEGWSFCDLISTLWRNVFFASEMVMFAYWVCSMQTFNGSNDHSRLEAPQAGPQFQSCCVAVKTVLVHTVFILSE